MPSVRSSSRRLPNSEAAASFLADSYKQYNDTETEADKNTIMEYVVMRYPNLDTNSIDNDTLRRF